MNSIDCYLFEGYIGSSAWKGFGIVYLFTYNFLISVSEARIFRVNFLISEIEGVLRIIFLSEKAAESSTLPWIVDEWREFLFSGNTKLFWESYLEKGRLSFPFRELGEK